MESKVVCDFPRIYTGKLQRVWIGLWTLVFLGLGIFSLGSFLTNQSGIVFAFGNREVFSLGVTAATILYFMLAILFFIMLMLSFCTLIESFTFKRELILLEHEIISPARWAVFRRKIVRFPYGAITSLNASEVNGVYTLTINHADNKIVIPSVMLEKKMLIEIQEIIQAMIEALNKQDL